jgi:von Willebrand factor type A domain
MNQTPDNSTPTGPWHIAFTAAFPGWLIFWGLFAAVALIVYLYLAQRKNTATWVIAMLTILRVALVSLLALILLQPSAQWVHTESLPGTLWLLLDRSKSMDFTDPQALPEERLRWACALGLISESQWPDEFDRDLAQLNLLRQLLQQDQDSAENITMASGSSTQRAQALADTLTHWRQSLEKLTDRLSGRPGARIVTNDLESLDQDAGDLIDQVRQAGGATAQGLPFAAMLAAMDQAMRDLNDAAESDDQQFLADHQSDPGVTDALHRAAAMSRAQLALALLTQNSESSGGNLASVIAQSRVQIVSFAGDVSTFPLPHNGDPALMLQSALSSTGDATNIAAAFAAVAQGQPSQEPARVVLVSDGRQNIGDDPEPIARLLAAHGVNTYTICVGSDRSPPSIQIDAVDAPQWVFKNQKVQASVLVHMRALANQPVTVELLRDAEQVGKEVIFSDSDDDVKPVQFTDNPPDVGVYHYDVRIEPTPNQIDQTPIERQFVVAVRRDKMQVILVEGQPRWEYQYLLNYLSRNDRVHLQAVLEHPALIQDVQLPAPVQASVNNPSYMAQTIPQGNQGWGAYDIIILGDVGPDVLSPADQQAIAYAVSEKGAALVLLSGQNSMPQAYASMPLSELIPVRLDRFWPPDLLAQQENQGFIPQLTVEGAASELAQLGADRAENDNLWSNMPRWYSHSAYTDARDNADVIWSMGQATGSGIEENLQQDKTNSLLSTMQVGSGRVLYIASDELWRLRYVNGENVNDDFWSQVIRWASGSELAAGGKYVRFETDKDTYTFGDPVHIQAHVLGDDLLPLSGLDFQVTATPLASGSSAAVPSVWAPMLASDSGPGYYSGSLSGLAPGRYRISLTGGSVDQRLREDPSAAVQNLVIQINPLPDLESLDPSSDPADMLRLASAGGGLMMPAAFGNLLATYMPPLQRTLSIPEETGFFTNMNSSLTRWLHTLFLIVFVILIGAEWAIRKFAGMI